MIIIMAIDKYSTMKTQLNIMDLHRSITEKKNRINESFEKVLKIIHKRIVSSADQRKLNCYVEVPSFVYGYPVYDYNMCIEYVFESLKKNGFYVKYYFPQYLYISWDFDEIKKGKTIGAAGQPVRDVYNIDSLMARPYPTPPPPPQKSMIGKGLSYQRKGAMGVTAKPSGKFTLDLV
jgi:hypothetical protein